MHPVSLSAARNSGVDNPSSGARENAEVSFAKQVIQNFVIRTGQSSKPAVQSNQLLFGMDVAAQFQTLNNDVQYILETFKAFKSILHNCLDPLFRIMLTHNSESIQLVDIQKLNSEVNYFTGTLDTQLNRMSQSEASFFMSERLQKSFQNCLRTMIESSCTIIACLGSFRRILKDVSSPPRDLPPNVCANIQIFNEKSTWTLDSLAAHVIALLDETISLLFGSVLNDCYVVLHKVSCAETSRFGLGLLKNFLLFEFCFDSSQL
jgi:hypothetical protein